MNSTERTKIFCKEHKIAIAKLERELGFANGYIGQLKKELPADRLMKIADYLNVSPDYLLNGEESDKSDNDNVTYYLNKQTSEIAEFLFKNPEHKVLFDASRKTKPEDIKFVKEMIDRINGEKG